MSFCQKCGKQLADEAQFCPSCGTPVENQTAQTQSAQQNVGQAQTNQYNQGAQYQYQQSAYQYQAPATPQYPPTLENFTKKVKVNGIIWIVIASIQAILALYYFGTGATLSSSYYYSDQASQLYLFGFVLAIVSVVNFIIASRDIKNSKLFLEKPVGIVQKYKPLSGYIGNLIYNFLFGGVFGIAGSIFGLYVRSIVTGNEAEFVSYENQYTATHQS